MSSTRVARRICAPREDVYRALLDPDRIAKWRVPDGMSAVVHEFDAREGGAFRVCLNYEVATGTGKTTANTDTYRGYFAKLVPHQQVIEVLEFETANPAFYGEMTITTTLADAADGTEVLVEHEGIPPGVTPEDNELGTQMALDKLAELVSTERFR
jgi:uncharacterized protein YndB with AHSA1/START domain